MAIKLNMTVPHDLTQDEAIRRIQSLLGDLEKEFAGKISNLCEEWNGNTDKFSFLAKTKFSISGTITVKDREVELSGNLPLAAILFKEKIESSIRERAENLLA